MLEHILPKSIAWTERYDDVSIDSLYPIEILQVIDAVPERQKEFATVRWCARQSMIMLGIPPVPIISGNQRAPCWPDGFVGSMTHCHGYRAAAVVSNNLFATIGIDAELHVPLPYETRSLVASESELQHLLELEILRPEIYWARLLFSIKESIYKAWFPITQLWLDFHQVNVSINSDEFTFIAKLKVDRLTGVWPFGIWLEGQWHINHNFIVTMLTIPSSINTCDRGL